MSITASTRAAARPSLPVPEPDLTPEEAIGRAQAMLPRLLERQAATEALTYYPPETHQEFLDAGLYRLLQPRQFGGYEFEPRVFFKVVIELARGCPSTAWCYCLCSAHVLQMTGVFDEAAQAEIFGADGEFRAACFGFHGGDLRPVEGGWRITGRWPYASGSPYSTHYIGHTYLPPETPGGPKGAEVTFVLPRSEWKLCDDWGDVLGLKGSGSHSVATEDGFVPSSHLIRGNLMMGRAARPLRVHQNPMYTGRQGAITSSELSAVAVGAAKGALDEYGRIITTRKATFQPESLRVDLPDYQRYYGRAAAMIAAGEAIVIRTAEEYLEIATRSARDGTPFPREDDMRLLLAAKEAGRLAWTAVQEFLFRTGGSSAAKDGQPLQRYFRDLSTYWSHTAPSADDFFAVQYARMVFGRDTEKTSVIPD